MQLLCLEDDPGLGVLLRRHLQQHGHQVAIAASLAAARTQLATFPVDLILVDHELPDGKGLDIIEEQAGAPAPIPAIMLTGVGNEELAVAAMQAGARDYMVKDIENNFLALLPKVLQRIQGELIAERDKIEAQRQLDQTRKQLRAVFDSSVDLFALCSQASTCHDISAFAVEQLGYAQDAVLGQSIVDALAIDISAGTIAKLIQGGLSGSPSAVTTTVANVNGDRVPVEVRIRTLSDCDFPQLWIIRNLSVRARLEAVEQEVIAVSHANSRLTAQNRDLTSLIRSQKKKDELIGHARSFEQVLRVVDQVAATDASVLICGDTGTGKEKIAQRLHNLSHRADKPFVAVNCAALPAHLFEGELFGYTKGAFTGAVHANSGRFLAANGGTLFLDEIGEIPIELQAKLLRALDERTIQRLGSNTEQAIDVRIIAATNQRLEQRISEQAFRADLFYRLNVIRIDLPGLRDRIEDIPLLLAHFAREFAQRHGMEDVAVSATVIQQARRYAWPGNVRELKNYIERSVVTQHWEPLPHCPPVSPNRPDDEETKLEDVDRSHILKVLVQTKGMIAGEKGAATILGMHPNTLRSRLKKLGVRRDGFTTGEKP